MVSHRSALILFAFILCALRSVPAQDSTQATPIESEETNICGVDCPPPLPLPKIYGAYVYCLKAEDQFLIGEHQAWEIGLSKLAHLSGRSLATRWDKRHIWVTLPNGWTVRLNQYNYEYPFRNVDCRDAARMRSLQHGYTRPQPVPGEPAQPVMHGDQVYGWALCSQRLDGHLLPLADELQCKVWDLDGQVRQDAIFKSTLQGTAAQWSDSLDGQFVRLHLKGGRTMKRVDSQN
jgi:hypothetical protein